MIAYALNLNDSDSKTGSVGFQKFSMNGMEVEFDIMGEDNLTKGIKNGKSRRLKKLGKRVRISKRERQKLKQNKNEDQVKARLERDHVGQHPSQVLSPHPAHRTVVNRPPPSRYSHFS